MQELYDAARGAFTRLPEDVPLPPKNVALDGADMGGLLDAFLTMLARRAPEPDAPRISNHVRPDAYTVRRQMVKIRGVLLSKASVAFEELFDGQTEKMEIIVTFMALLEMIAHGEIRLKQSAPFAPIAIRAGRILEDDADYHYIDEVEE